MVVLQSSPPDLFHCVEGTKYTAEDCPCDPCALRRINEIDGCISVRIDTEYVTIRGLFDLFKYWQQREYSSQGYYESY